MAIDEDTGPDGGAGLAANDTTLVKTLDCTRNCEQLDYAHQADSNSSSSTESSRLLTGTDIHQMAVSIDASIKKLTKMENAENTTLQIGNGPEDLRGCDNSATEASIEPPDGGIRAWMIMISSFVINGVLFGIINTYSLIYLELQRRLTEAGETEASSKAALVGSLTIGTTFLLSPVSGILTDKFGIRVTTFIGGAIASAGLFLSSMLLDKVELLYLTYGAMYGLGASLAYTPSLVILGHYFKKYLGLVNGIVTAGSSVFTTVIPYLTEYLLKRFGLEGTMRCLTLLTAIIMACAILFKPRPLNVPEQDLPQTRTKSRNRLKEIVNVSIWRRKRYVLWATSIPIALFGYFVPYVHIGKFVTTTFKNADEKLPVMCIGITSGIGRLVFGYIADLPKVNRILLQQISFVSIGIFTMLLPVTNSFIMVLIISLAMGLFDGCFISLLGPIAFDICGHSGASQGIGFLLGMCSIPLTIGPPIAGLLYDHTGSYKLPLLLAGVPPIIGALAMFLIRCVKEDKDENINNSSPENTSNKESCKNENIRRDIFLSKSFADCKQEDELKAQRKYSIFYKNLQSSQHYRASRVESEGCLSNYNNKHINCCRYSESAPLIRTNSFRGKT